MILLAFLLRGECSVWIKCSVPPKPANGNPAASSGTPPAPGALQRQEGFRRCCHREATSLPGDHLPLSASDPPSSRGTKTSTYQESRILLRPSCTNSGGKLVGKNTFGDKFDRNAISGPFVRGASPPWSRARRSWKSSLPVYGNWGLSSETQVILMLMCANGKEY